MKVLHVLKAMEIGGVPTVALELTKALSRHGIHCEIATVDNMQSDHEQLPANVPMHLFQMGFLNRLWPCYSTSLSRFLNAEASRFDLIHIHGLWNHATYAASHAAQLHHIPYVISTHSALEAWTLGQHAWIKRLYMPIIQKPIIRAAAAIHCLTNEEQNDVANQGIKTKTFITPNGISPDFPDILASNNSSNFLSRYPELSGKQVILFVGRLATIKGLEILADSFSSIASRFPNTMLLVVGPDARDGTKDRMVAKLNSSGTQNRVIFTGQVPVRDWLAAYTCATLFILPSFAEGFGLVVLEAMAAGLPVIISDRCYGTRSIVKNAKAGLVVPPKKETLVEAMTLLLRDKQRCAQMRRNGRTAIVNYTWPALAKSMETHYVESIKRNCAQHSCD